MKLNDLFFFVHVVESRGFAAASRSLGVPKSTLSKRVAELEIDLGARLLHRTTRQVALTDVGESFFRHAKAALLEAEAAGDAVRRRLSEPQGLVRISASSTTVQTDLADLLPELTRRYPKIQVGVVVTSRYVDLVQEGIDVAIRVHRGVLPNSDLVQRRLGYAPNYLVASPSYLAEHGNPARPEALAAHACVAPETSAAPFTWTLLGPEGAVVSVQPAVKLFADDPVLIVKAALAGMTVASLPHRLVRPHIESGGLVRLLPLWEMKGATTTLLMPHRRGQLPSVRAVVDFLAEQMAA
ncbi:MULTISPECIES: LysR substrate-binding domain-containing protein [Brevundimonas]|uniref:LysR substrate-binding domain-containing protein n=1 Tax=Brevundimonas TaxID=41275 RepID=UPI0019057F28|nr:MULTISPECIES: LysR substrate-binding domain-containing protein [Brevundimonas]MDA0744416.1 LysR substrate-binding domain-containing protein [Pseudomonadota bacterium]MBK1970284.1 LysR family transcriptional regulator [Brevundimonas diminuta]MBK1975873.1 LysR family transcriptional regulator [Brevundimonas diminuta]MDA1322219.1 LysR substrate-binding domain-containing protein [Pseudomonadota bacterium]MDM8353836.1 LysR substrate-binding domain-containing protein [Brevundimonas diminuta]